MVKTAKVLNIQEIEEDDHIEAQHSKTLVGYSGTFSVPPVDQIDEWSINVHANANIILGLCIFILYFELWMGQ